MISLDFIEHLFLRFIAQILVYGLHLSEAELNPKKDIRPDFFAILVWLILVCPNSQILSYKMTTALCIVVVVTLFAF